MDPILDALNAWRQSTEFAAALPWLRAGVAAAATLLALTAVLTPADVLADIREALRHAGIPDKVVAMDMEISKGLASLKLHGERPLTVQALAKLPTEFWQWLAVELAERHGMPQEIETGARLARAVKEA
jgi:hypothetical protein